jgi:hypothetical protein
MGMTGLDQLQQFQQQFLQFKTALDSNGAVGQSTTLPALGQESGEESAGAVSDLFTQTVPASETYDALAYHSYMERVSMSAEFQQIKLLASAGEDGETAAAAAEFTQLTFDFDAEIRAESLTLFKQRTDAVAEGLEGEQQETFAAASQRVAARFEMSMSVSGQVLNGFAGAAEGLQGEDTSAGFGQLLTLAEDALAQVDEALNQVFELLGGFFSGIGEGDFEASFNEFINQLLGSGLFGGGSSTGTGEEGGSLVEGASYQIQLEFSFEFSAEITVEEGEVRSSDPITFDLDGDGIELTGYGNGARFDINADGRTDTTAFVTGGDAFLALDRNGNGKIDNGAELFGDQRGAANGYEELAKLDSNGDGVIDKQDEAYEDLVLWKDNGNGKTEEGELVSLAEAGIESISLRYDNVNEKAAGGNRIAQAASFKRTDGSTGRTVDSILNFTA